MRGFRKLILITMNTSSTGFLAFVFFDMLTHHGLIMLQDTTFVLPCEVVLLSTVTTVNLVWVKNMIWKVVKS